MMELLTLLGTVFAGVAAFGWIWDKYVAHRDRPLPMLVFHNNSSLTYEGNKYELLTISNTGNADADIGKMLLLKDIGPARELPGYEMPYVIKARERAQLACEWIDREKSYVIYVLNFLRGRVFHTVVRWAPVHREGQLGERFRRTDRCAAATTAKVGARSARSATRWA